MKANFTSQNIDKYTTLYKRTSRLYFWIVRHFLEAQNYKHIVQHNKKYHRKVPAVQYLLMVTHVYFTVAESNIRIITLNRIIQKWYKNEARFLTIIFDSLKPGDVNSGKMSR